MERAMKRFFTIVFILFLCNQMHASFVAFNPLLNSGSSAMNVNGTTPKAFTYSPGISFRLRNINILMEHTGSTPFNHFGALASALTNGILIQYSINGTTKTFATVKTNADLVTAFPDMQHFGNSATLSILGIVTAEGFGNSTNIFKGQADLGMDVILGASDSITATVQDNLSTLGTLQMSVVVDSDS
jgi:hypothetical protein